MTTLTLPLIPLLDLDRAGGCPCGSCERPGKHPAVKWRHVTVGRRRYGSIEEYLDGTKYSRVAARMGNGVFCLDFDPRSNGFEARANLEDEFRPLPPTAVALTGDYGGVRGEHYYYSHNPSIRVPNRVLSDLLGKDFGGIDIKGDGGLAVVPPTTHPSGVRYEWQAGFDEIEEAPDWLVALLEGGAKRDQIGLSGATPRKRTGKRPTREVLRWVFAEEGIPSPQWLKIARITGELWDDPEERSTEEIGSLIYEALIRSPDYDESRPWSRSERIKDAARLLSKERIR